MIQLQCFLRLNILCTGPQNCISLYPPPWVISLLELKIEVWESCYMISCFISLIGRTRGGIHFKEPTGVRVWQGSRVLIASSVCKCTGVTSTSQPTARPCCRYLLYGVLIGDLFSNTIRGHRLFQLCLLKWPTGLTRKNAFDEKIMTMQSFARYR